MIYSQFGLLPAQPPLLGARDVIRRRARGCRDGDRGAPECLFRIELRDGSLVVTRVGGVAARCPADLPAIASAWPCRRSTARAVGSPAVPDEGARGRSQSWIAWELETKTMKVRASIKARCERCKIIRRKGVVIVICTNPEAQAKAGIEAESLQPSACSRYPRGAWAEGLRGDVNGRTESGSNRRQTSHGIGAPEAASGSSMAWKPTTTRQILQRTNVSLDTLVRDLTEDEVNRIREIIDREFKVEGDLRAEVNLNIKRLMEIGCYRDCGIAEFCRVHGQRTRTNARMRKGPRRTVAGRWQQRRSNEESSGGAKGEARGGAAT